MHGRISWRIIYGRFGIEPEAPVGICVERSLEMVIGLLGILKAGWSAMCRWIQRIRRTVWNSC